MNIVIVISGLKVSTAALANLQDREESSQFIRKKTYLFLVIFLVRPCTWSPLSLYVRLALS